MIAIRLTSFPGTLAAMRGTEGALRGTRRVTAMLAWIVLQVPLALFPAPQPPACQLEVLPPVVLEERVLREFDRQVSLYVRLHRRLERWLPPEPSVDNAAAMPLATDALHAALVEARPYARDGGFFTPAVADVLTRRIELAIISTGLTPAGALLAMKHGYGVAPDLRVNDRFTGVRHVYVWPALLAVLPALPHELVYRFVGRDLVIVDLHADLVVDILKNALPPPPVDPAGYSAAPRNTPLPVQEDAA
jgi:hypothetical protein